MSGFDPAPQDDTHNHDNRYPSVERTRCESRESRARIIGTPAPSVGTNIEVVAGYVVDHRLDLDIVALGADPVQINPARLEIVEYTDPGAGPYSGPIVRSVIVSTGTASTGYTYDKVTVEWGPGNADATISLKAIADAVAANEQAAALLRIDTCDCSQFAGFTAGDIIPYPEVTEPTLDVEQGFHLRSNGKWTHLDVGEYATWELAFDAGVTEGQMFYNTTTKQLERLTVPAAWAQFTIPASTGMDTTIVAPGVKQTIGAAKQSGSGVGLISTLAPFFTDGVKIEDNRHAGTYRVTVNIGTKAGNPSATGILDVGIIVDGASAEPWAEVTAFSGMQFPLDYTGLHHSRIVTLSDGTESIEVYIQGTHDNLEILGGTVLVERIGPILPV